MHHPAPLPARQPGQPWSIRDVVSYLGVCERSVCQRIATGEIPNYTIGRRRLVADHVVREIAAHGLTAVQDESTPTA